MPLYREKKNSRFLATAAGADHVLAHRTGINLLSFRVLY